MTNDLIEYVDKNIKDIAESHLECWKERYQKHGGNRAAFKFDLKVNHDNSLEVESCEETLERELTAEEEEWFVNKFHKAVYKQWKSGNL